MFYSQIEQELSNGEHWYSYQPTQLPPHLQHLVEQEQRDINLHNKTFIQHNEQRYSSRWIPLETVNTLYQLVSQYLFPAVFRKG